MRYCCENYCSSDIAFVVVKLLSYIVAEILLALLLLAWFFLTIVFCCCVFPPCSRDPSVCLCFFFSLLIDVFLICDHVGKRKELREEGHVTFDKGRPAVSRGENCKIFEGREIFHQSGSRRSCLSCRCFGVPCRWGVLIFLVAAALIVNRYSARLSVEERSRTGCIRDSVECRVVSFWLSKKNSVSTFSVR